MASMRRPATIPGPRRISGTASVVWIDEEAVERLLMLARALRRGRTATATSVCDLQPQTVERVVQLTDQRVGVGDLAVVGPIAIARRVAVPGGSYGSCGS